jgi:hypothetical protein
LAKLSPARHEGVAAFWRLVSACGRYFGRARVLPRTEALMFQYRAVQVSQMSRLASYIDGRLFEWVMSIAMFSLGAELVLWPPTISASSFRNLSADVPAAMLALFFISCSLARMAALIVNGRSWVYGPRVRAYGALGAAIIWSWMLTALFTLLADNRAIPSPGIPIFLSLVLGELYTSYRAAKDVRKSL